MVDNPILCYSQKEINEEVKFFQEDITLQEAYSSY